VVEEKEEHEFKSSGNSMTRERRMNIMERRRRIRLRTRKNMSMIRKNIIREK